MKPTKPPVWPSDDQIRERDGKDQFTGDGRKLQDSERVGGLAPDADPDPGRAPTPTPETPR